MHTFVHTSVRTRNMEKSIDFYTRLLGLELKSRREISANSAEIAFLRDPNEKGATLELTSYQNQTKFIQADYEDRIFDHLAFEVLDMEETLSRMRNEGITITDEPFRIDPDGALIAFLEDPDGTLIELIEGK